MAMSNVQRIQCGSPEVRTRTRRVGAYCRVSTLLESQQLSLETQMEGFKQKIAKTPGWKLVDIYADEGITGTSTKKRKEFRRMIQDAQDGKIDTIITKSISRFARNTLDCLKYVDDLKQIGVNVFFEKEQIDTATASGEMLLTILSAFAQEESRNISENLKWGLRKRYEMGQGRWSALYGFRLDEKGEAVIEPGEGEIVRSIFDLYREGTTLPEIVTKLNDLKITSPRGKKWTESTVLGILRNERYAGDMILQKWISTDFKTHKCIPNDGKEVPTYRIENSHVPIIDKRTFKQVQRILELRAPRGEITRYPYVDSKIICPYCGMSLIPRQMHVQQKKKAMCCFGEEGCHGFSVKTWMLDEVLRAAFEEVDPEDVKGNGDAAKRMREAQRIGTPPTIEYWFLDDLVKEVTFSCTNGSRLQKHKKGPATTEKTYDWEVTVHWQCGLATTVPLPMDKNQTEEPTHVAELYETYLNRVDSGEYIPARPKSIFEKQLVAQKRVTKIGGTDDHQED